MCRNPPPACPKLSPALLAERPPTAWLPPIPRSAPMLRALAGPLSSSAPSPSTPLPRLQLNPFPSDCPIHARARSGHSNASLGAHPAAVRRMRRPAPAPSWQTTADTSHMPHPSVDRARNPDAASHPEPAHSSHVTLGLSRFLAPHKRDSPPFVANMHPHCSKRSEEHTSELQSLTHLVC